MKEIQSFEASVNLIKTFQIEGMIELITKMTLIFFFRLVKWPKIAVKKSQNFKKF